MTDGMTNGRNDGQPKSSISPVFSIAPLFQSRAINTLKYLTISILQSYYGLNFVCSITTETDSANTLCQPVTEKLDCIVGIIYCLDLFSHIQQLEAFLMPDCNIHPSINPIPRMPCEWNSSIVRN